MFTSAGPPRPVDNPRAARRVPSRRTAKISQKVVNIAQHGADKLGEYLLQCSKKRAVESIIPAYDLQ